MESKQNEALSSGGIWINWVPPKPREGVLGSWDKFVGPGATGAEEYVQIGIGTLIAAACLLLFSIERGATASVLQWAFIVFLALDIGGGIVTNSTSAAKRWYHRKGHGMSKHMTFVCAHLIHIALVAYSKDMQEDKEVAFDAFDSLSLALAAMTGMINDLKVNRNAMREAAGSGFSTATDLADWLVREANVPFRDAHHITGSAVAMAESKGCDLDALTIEDFKEVDERIDSRVFKVLSVENSVKSRTSYGGTAPNNVREQAARWKERLAAGEEA